MNAVRRRWQQIRALRLGRALRMVWQITPLWSALNLALIAVQGLLPLAALYAMKRIVDAAAEQSVRDVLTWAAIAAGVALFNALMQAVSEYSNQAQSQLLTDEISDILHARSIAVDLGYYEQPTYYDTLHRAQQEGPYRPAGILSDLVRILQSAISLAGIAVLLVSFHWQVGIVMLLAALPGLAVRLFFSRRQYNFELQQAENERFAWYYHWLITDAGHAAELRLYGLGELFRRRFRELRAALRQGRLRLALRQSGYSFAVRALAALALFGAFAFAAAETVRGLLTLGSLVVIYLGFQNGLGYLQGMLNALASLYESNLFLTQFYQFLDLPVQIKAPAQPRDVPRPMRQGITFEGVRFAYPGSESEALRGVDITLRPGEVIALVGENGAGKTTLIKLLCRLYDPAAGRVRVDGADLRELDPRAWQAQISVVFQDFARYFLSAGENIWLGDAAQPAGAEGVRRAARLAGADGALEKLPAGYETPLGKAFSGGSDLSQGEWQKVALARAFYRENAGIVVLDEPTSALDPLAEAELFARFRDLIAGRSAILISHRFSTVQMADRIYVLEHGRVTEHGTHADLLARGGQYARMYTAQAQYYQETGHEQPTA